jgi:hypothetical protein
MPCPRIVTELVSSKNCTVPTEFEDEDTEGQILVMDDRVNMTDAWVDARGSSTLFAWEKRRA